MTKKLELRIANTERTRDSAILTLSKSQEALDALIAKGVTTGLDYEQAVARVALSQQNLQNQEEKLNIAQSDLTQGQIQFAIGVLPAVQGAITGVQGAMSALRAIQTLTSASQAVTTATTGAQSIAMGGLAASTGAAAGATGGLSLAVRLLQVAMGPVGWIILGIGTFLALFATNAFGVRDAINAMGKAIGDALPFLKPLLDALASIANTIFPQTEEKSKDFADSTTTDLGKAGEEYALLMSKADTMEGGVTSSFQGTATASGRAMEDLAKSVDKQADSIVSDAKRIEKAMKDIGGATPSGISSGESSSSKKSANPFTDIAGPFQLSKSSVSSGSTGGGAGNIINAMTIIIKVGERDLKKVFGDVKSDDTLNIV